MRITGEEEEHVLSRIRREYFHHTDVLSGDSRNNYVNSTSQFPSISAKVKCGNVVVHSIDSDFERSTWLLGIEHNFGKCSEIRI